jgi:chromosome partitioning protein
VTRLAVFNQKGGVGKTTTALNLGGALASRGLRPIMVDLDAQAHLSGILGPVERAADSIFGLFAEDRDLVALMRRVPLGMCDGNAGAADLLPAHADLMKVDSLFGKGPRVLYRLKEGLDALPEEERGADRPLLIDCCPMLGVLSLSGVFAAERLLVPVSSDYLAVKGALQLESTLKALEHVFKRRVERRYVLTRFDARRKMAHEIAAELRRRFGPELCEVRIAESVGLAESPYHGRDIFAHDARSRGAADYAALAEELLGSGFVAV